MAMKAAAARMMSGELLTLSGKLYVTSSSC
jgi:hypothetical protein